MDEKEEIVRHHYSGVPVKLLEPIKPWEPKQAALKPGGFSNTLKPRGFWYEVNGDWRRWCESEKFDDLERKHCYRVELGNERILMIRGCGEFDAFHARYAKPLEAERWSLTKRPDWKALFDDGYDGIEISPYLWERRLADDCLWYYGWDCASGVIWTPRGARLVLEKSPIDAET